MKAAKHFSRVTGKCYREQRGRGGEGEGRKRGGGGEGEGRGGEGEGRGGEGRERGGGGEGEREWDQIGKAVATMAAHRSGLSGDRQ